MKLHLGGMDAKDAWRRLEPRVDELLDEVGEAGHDVGEKVLEGLRKMKGSLEKLRGDLRH